MIIDAIKYVRKLISRLFNYIMSFPTWFSDSVSAIQLFIRDQRRKFNNLLETNLELGKHHFFQGHIKDATLRFRITHWLFDSNNKEIDYWLGWCYFMSGDYKAALPHIEQGKEYDHEGLGAFIKNYEKVSEVPYRVWDVIQRVAIAQDEERYHLRNIYNKPVDLPLEFITLILESIEDFRDGYKILDYGAGSGLTGSMLDYSTDTEYHITAIEGVDIFLDYIKDIQGERGPIYDKVLYNHLNNVEGILKSEKYDIIMSFNSISFALDLKKYLNAFSKHLTDKGYLALLLPEGSVSEWSQIGKSFIYSEEDLKEQLKLAKFNIISIKKWSIKTGTSYIGFICSR